jgi:hypothetical protein
MRTTASTGVPETATITAAARTVLDDASVSAMVDTLGGASATGTGGLARAASPTFTGTVGADDITATDAITADRFIHVDGTFAYSATPTLDLGNGGKLNWCMSDDMTGDMAPTLSNGADGMVVRIAVSQDGGGGNKITDITVTGYTVRFLNIGATINTDEFMDPDAVSIITVELMTVAGTALAFVQCATGAAEGYA